MQRADLRHFEDRIWSIPGGLAFLAYLGWAVAVFLAVPWLGALAPGLAVAPYVVWLGLAVSALSESGQGARSRALGWGAAVPVLAYVLIGYPSLDANGHLLGSATFTLVVHACVALCLLATWHRIARALSDSASPGARAAVYVGVGLAVFFPPTAFALVHSRIAAIQRLAP